MSFFGVTLEEIKTVEHHPNADRLDIATLDGISFQFVIGRDSHSVGEKVLYFPIDSLLPENIAEKLGVRGKLSGKNKNRIKTVRLRGVYSQGIVGKLEDFYSLIGDETDTQIITEKLGVTKYEPPMKPCKAGSLVQLPCGLSVYDIEGVERNQKIVNDFLMDKEVVITEKLEGQNFSVTYDVKNQKIYVNQRKFSIKPVEEKGEHVFWKVAQNKGWIDFVKYIAKSAPQSLQITVYGEFLGPSIQNNIYKLQDYTVRSYDIFIDGKFIDFSLFKKYIDSFFGEKNESIVPIIAIGKLREILGGQSITEYSNGKSKLNYNTLREGVVIKPLIEESINKFGRLIIKQRDPIYLSKDKN